MMGKVISEFWRRVDPIHGCLTVAAIVATSVAQANDALGAVPAAAIASLCVAGCAAIDKYADSRDPEHGRLATIKASSPTGSEFKEVAEYLLVAYVELDAVLLLVMQAEMGARTLSDDEARRIILFYESFNSKFTPLSEDLTIKKAFIACVNRSKPHHGDLGPKTTAKLSRITTKSLPVDPDVRMTGSFLLAQGSNTTAVDENQAPGTAVEYVELPRVLPGRARTGGSHT
ncbi:hypothetical protein BD626DRAFT_205384 [Schizophyllum amplum]|uniref:Uncharacterized protein n=1 Tax=Schizophyllum amplum TaxID=97359 RepID=A0A550BZG9_9AGAR|nr:hypothetical protein BD626DRAFT_205384 [Auriculariopsis ampla]